MGNSQTSTEIEIEIDREKAGAPRVKQCKQNKWSEQQASPDWEWETEPQGQGLSQHKPRGGRERIQGFACVLLGAKGKGYMWMA